MTSSARSARRNWLFFWVSTSCGVVITAIGYLYLLGAHLGEHDPLPILVRLTVPFAALGPPFPSWAEFGMLALANVVLWAACTWLVARGISKVSNGQGSQPKF